MYHPYFDRVAAWATEARFKDDVSAAHEAFFARTGGAVFEDDKSIEQRLASFLDWYVFDRPRPPSGATPAAEFLELFAGEIHPSELPIYRGFCETVRGLFELRGLPKAARVTVREACSGLQYKVTERRALAGLARGDLFEARLVPFQGEHYFSASFCFHPRAVRKAILAEVKRRRKAGSCDPGSLLDQLLTMALKYERYRNVAVEAIYDFRATEGERGNESPPQDRRRGGRADQ